MDWFGQGALPIGFLMFFGMLFAVMRRHAGHRAAARELPRLAEKKGLKFKPARERGSIGSISGTLEGFWVSINPDEKPRVSLRFTGSPEIELKNYVPQRPSPHGWERFVTGDKRSDRYFKTRYAAQGLARRLCEQGEIWSALGPVVQSYDRQLKELSISSEGISFVFDFGNPPYLPSHAAEMALTAALSLAHAIEPNVSS